MTDQFISVGRPSFLKRLTEIAPGIYADSVVSAAAIVADEVVVAGAASVLGKIGTVAQNVTLYVRADCSAKGYTGVDWRVKSDQAYELSFFKAREIVDSQTITLASLANGETGIINGLTFTATDAAASVSYLTRNFYSGGAGDTEDAASLKKAINPGTALTLSTVTAGQQVIVNGVTFTAHATTTTAASREFSIAGTDAEDATELASVLNDATYGCGITCEAFGAEVSFPGTVAVTPPATITVTAWPGVPGVTATSALGVVTIVPTTATTIHSVTGTAAAHWAVASTTLLGLMPDANTPPVTGLAADTTSAGPVRRQWIDGYPHPYIGVKPTAATAANIVVGATPIP